MLEEAGWLSMQRCGRVVVVRLHRMARNLDEIGQMTRFLDTSHRECQAPLLLLGLPALGLELPSESLRSHIFSNIRQRFATGVLEQAFLVVPTGNVLKRALVRSFFTGMRLALGLHNRTFPCETIEEAVQALVQRHGGSAPELLRVAQELTVSSGPASAAG